MTSKSPYLFSANVIGNPIKNGKINTNESSIKYSLICDTRFVSKFILPPSCFNFIIHHSFNPKCLH